MEPTIIFLVGFMGAGKTTVGRELARVLGWSFVDLDARIEAKQGKNIAQIFAHQGEIEFRKLETHALRELLGSSDPEDPEEEPEPMVVALGGGAFPQEINRQLIRERGGRVVYLEVELKEAMRRCEQTKLTRPLLSDEKLTAELMETRRPFYEIADLRVRTDGQLVDEIVQKICLQLGLTPCRQEAE
ncbi:MAG TPA: shikimate kinase [Terriglobales bacterium]